MLLIPTAEVKPRKPSIVVLVTLNKRQKQILAMVVTGHETQEIATKLGKDYQYMKNTVSKLIKAFGTKNRTHLAYLILTNDYAREVILDYVPE